MKKVFLSLTLSTMLMAAMITPSFAADEKTVNLDDVNTVTTYQLSSQKESDEDLNAEAIIIEHLKKQGKSYSVGSEEYNTYIHNIPWYVDSSLTNHPKYSDLITYAIEYENNNLNKQIAQKDYIADQDKTVMIYDNVPVASEALSYNRQQVVNYAYGWATNGGTKRNSAFDNYSNDCTNFVSQAWNAGGNIMRAPNSVPSGILDTTSYWYSYKRGTSFDVSTPWIRVVDLYAYWVGNRGVITASYDDTDFDRSILRNNAEPGDIVQLAPASGGAKFHSMIVTKKDSTDIYFTYHSGPNNKDVVDKSLSQITGNKYHLLKFGS